MSAINLASKFANKVAEAFQIGSITDSARGTDFEFTGVKTLKVLSVDTVPLNDYARSGANRYGSPVELGDSVQEMTMTQDKSFSMTIDKGNNADQMNLKGAARAMRRETEQVVIPHVDKYRLDKWAHGAGIIVGLASAPAKGNIADLIFEAGAAMDDELVPREKRTLFLKNKDYALLKASDAIIGNDDLGKKVVTRGEMGEFDGMTVKRVPDSYMPANAYFMIKYKNATADPVKLNETNVHQDPPGISGNLLEGRFYHDAFVLNAKANGIYVAVAASAKCAAPTATKGASTTTLASTTSGATITYTDDGTDPRYSSTAKVYSAAINNPDAGVVLKAVASKDGMYASDVLTHTCV